MKRSGIVGLPQCDSPKRWKKRLRVSHLEKPKEENERLK